MTGIADGRAHEHPSPDSVSRATAAIEAIELSRTDLLHFHLPGGGQADGADASAHDGGASPSDGAAPADGAAPSARQRLATAIEIADWRRHVHGIYAEVRRLSNIDLLVAHSHWIRSRNALFARHPATPLLPDDREAFESLPIAPYDPAWRFEVEVTASADNRRMDVETGTDGIVPFEHVGVAEVPGIGSLDVWRLTSYGGGLFVPVKDALAGRPGGTYGGGRYLLDTVKGADLGTGLRPSTLVLDFNFAYNPSCAYDPAWACPLAQAGNTLAVEVPVGERYH